jgi:hypothetical protein
LPGCGAFASKCTDVATTLACRKDGLGLDLATAGGLSWCETIFKGERMRRPATHSHKYVALIAAATALALPARADDAPYVGTWALDIANCKTPQDSQDAPLVIAKDRYDQHEVHCTFKSVDAKESDYRVAGDCIVEGNAQSYDFTLTVSGDTLTFTDEAGARDFLRCK